MLSEKNKFIFIHIPKTGGSSIEEFLLKNESVKTPLSRANKIKFNTGTLLTQHKKITKFKLSQQKKFFCFCFVRNPWDKVASDYFWVKKKPRFRKLSFKDYIGLLGENLFKGRNCSQLEFVNENIDFVGRFESLQKDFDKVCEKININKGILPKKNCGNHQDMYRSIYDTHTKNEVYKIFKKDIQYFKYSF